MNAGSETGHKVRIKNNMVNIDNPVAPLYTLRKDHKQYSDNVSAPPARPVCGVLVGYNCKLSHMIDESHTYRGMEIKLNRHRMYEYGGHDS